MHIMFGAQLIRIKIFATFVQSVVSQFFQHTQSNGKKYLNALNMAPHRLFSASQFMHSVLQKTHRVKSFGFQMPRGLTLRSLLLHSSPSVLSFESAFFSWRVFFFRTKGAGTRRKVSFFQNWLHEFTTWDKTDDERPFLTTSQRVPGNRLFKNKNF